jgi:histidine triad (HIT) family protein
MGRESSAEESETIFSKIIRKEIPADIVYEDERVLAFRDINPVAPVHILVIPKDTIVNVAHAKEEDRDILGELLLVAGQIARNEGLEESGYRIVTNNGLSAGQTVFHLHLHLIGGRPMDWPPG